MPTKPRLQVIEETPSGLNKKFEDTQTGETLTRRQVADKIERGEYPGHHIMRVGGKRIPRSNPDGSKANNLG